MSSSRTVSRLPLLAAVLALLLLVAFGAAAPVAADAGPKPSLLVRVVHGPSADDYYLDLLVPADASGIADDGIGGYANENEWVKGTPIFAYAEGGRVGLLCHGFMVFGDLAGDPGPAGSVQHSFGYLFVPRTFAVIVQDRATGALTVSNTVTTTQFDALVQYDATKNVLTVLQNTGSLWWWMKLLIRIFGTVLVECLLVLPFRFPKRRWLPIPVNLATQGLLNIVVLAVLPGLFQQDYLLWFGLFEGLVLLLEFLAYFFWMAERRFWKPFLYALLANAATLAVGLWWMA